MTAIQMERARRKLGPFVKHAWSIVEPAVPFVDNWHVGAICEHLEAVSKGEIRRLLINIPPGHAKSLLVAVFWPVWQWIHRPQWRAIFSSYSHDLATRDAMRSRSLIESEWFQTNFIQTLPDEQQWTFTSDLNKKDHYKNTKSGERFTTSTEATATGFRGDTVVVDDPLNAVDAVSEAKRNKCVYWWDKAMSNRVNEPDKASFVVIMQRLHEQDLSGHVLEQGGYQHLCLPSEFDQSRKTITYKINGEKFWEDPRTEDGELLFPTMFSENALAEARVALGPDGFAGQHLQSPTDPKGGMFQRSWWRFWRQDGVPECVESRPEGCNRYPARILPTTYQQVISLDATFKGGKDNDYTVFTVWGVLGADKFLLDMRRDKMTFTECLPTFRDLCRKWPNAKAKYVEEAANGAAVIDVLRTEIPGIIAVRPEGGKEARAASIQPEVHAGNVYLPEGVPWIHDFVAEFSSFPRGKHDDIVDSTSQALVQLGNSPDLSRAIALSKL